MSKCDKMVQKNRTNLDMLLHEHQAENLQAYELLRGLLTENKADIVVIEKEIKNLEASLDNQVDPLKRATTQLHGRTQRYDIERTR